MSHHHEPLHVFGFDTCRWTCRWPTERAKRRRLHWQSELCRTIGWFPGQPDKSDPSSYVTRKLPLEAKLRIALVKRDDVVSDENIAQEDTWEAGHGSHECQTVECVVLWIEVCLDALIIEGKCRHGIVAWAADIAWRDIAAWKELGDYLVEQFWVEIEIAGAGINDGVGCCVLSHIDIVHEKAD